jgi:hypothetical protein
MGGAARASGPAPLPTPPVTLLRSNAAFWLLYDH